MKVRTFLLTIGVLVGLLVLVSFYVNNDAALGEQLVLWGESSINVGVGLLVAAFLGMALMSLIGASHEASTMLERWRLRKASRKSDEIEEEYSRGLVAVLEGREEEGLGHFRAVLERNSRHFNTLIKIGEVLRFQGRFDEAVEYHRKAHHLNQASTRPLYALVEDHEARGDMDRALAVLGKIIGVNKNSVTAWRRLRSLHLKQSNWARALEAHERVEKLVQPRDPDDHRIALGIRFEIACGRMSSGKLREAQSAFRRLIKDSPEFIPAYASLGNALDRDDQTDEAVKIWSRGFAATGSPIFLTLLEHHFLEREEPLQAIEALKSCIRESRKDTVPRFYLGKLYFRLEMLDDAMSVLSSLEGRATYAPTLHYLLGRIHERRGNLAKSSVEYRKVIREMDLVELDYECGSCKASATAWQPRCGSCGTWNTIEVNFREEIPLEELGISSAPVYPTAR